MDVKLKPHMDDQKSEGRRDRRDSLLNEFKKEQKKKKMMMMMQAERKNQKISSDIMLRNVIEPNSTLQNQLLG